MRNLLKIILLTLSVSLSHSASLIEDITNLCCVRGELLRCLEACEFANAKDNADIYLVRSTLELILHANLTGAIELRRIAKSINATSLPPLALQHMNGLSCGGLGDLFYVSAIVIQTYAASEISPVRPTIQYFNTVSQLLTLISDSGLHSAAEVHASHALNLFPNKSSLLFRTALMTPAIFESLEHVESTRKLLSDRINSLLLKPKLRLKSLDEFVLSPTFYFVYQGYNDKEILSKLHSAYARAHPELHQVMISSNVVDSSSRIESNRQIRVGFVSKHFRRHSVCKLFCGILTGLDPANFKVFAFSSLQESLEDEVTLQLRQAESVSFVPVGSTVISSRNQVLDRHIDVLVYLDVGMDPATVVWAAARLVPIQVR